MIDETYKFTISKRSQNLNENLDTIVIAYAPSSPSRYN